METLNALTPLQEVFKAEVRQARHGKASRQLMDLLAAVDTGLQLLQTEDKPDLQEAVAMLRGACRVREWAKGEVLLLSKGGRTEAGKAFRAAWDFRRGNGSLWGPMGWSLRDGGLFQRADTLAVLVCIITGARMHGSEAWARALGKGV